MAPAAVIVPIPGAASTPTLEAAERQTVAPGRVLTLRSSGELGGAIQAASDYDPVWVWLLDSGVVPEPTALERLLEAAGRMQPPAALLASKVLAPDGVLDRASTPVPEVHRGDRVIAALAERAVPLRVARRGSLLVRIEALEESGALAGFDRDLAWTARLLSRLPGVLEPASVAVRTCGVDDRAGSGFATTLRLLAALEPRERLWFIVRSAEEALASWRRRGGR